MNKSIFLKFLKFLLFTFIFTACSTFNFNQLNVPIEKPQKYRFAQMDTPPGAIFKPNFNLRIDFDSKGNFLLAPGDYLIPVMTYCMDSSGSSPVGHSYSLAQMQGSRAQIIRDLNLKALPKFSIQDTQILSWSIQNGLKYDEMTDESKKIIDSVIPEHKKTLESSLIEGLERKWNQLAVATNGVIPSTNEATNKLLSSNENLSTFIENAKIFRSDLKEVGNDYEALSKRIQIIKNTNNKSSPTPWSQISKNVYARFITTGHYQQLGQIQIRVLSNTSRTPNSENEFTVVDLLSWLADPNQPGIQPLSFSPIYGYGGVLVIPALAEAPLLATAVLGAVLAAQTIDWDAFQKLSETLQNVKDRDVQKKIAEGQHLLHEMHDKLEKPLREKGIIDRKTRKTSTDEKNSTREYTKSGGEKALNEDFDKLGGPTKKIGDKEIKQVETDIKAVKRPPTDDKLPTIEMQPEKTGNKIDDSIRVKIRYE